MTALDMQRYESCGFPNARPLADRRPGNKEPATVVVGEVALTVENGTIRIGFSRGHKPVRISGRQEFETILKEVALGKYEYTDLKPRWLPDLSLGIKDNCYVVMRLSSDLNWQFIRDAAPFSLSPSANSDIYYDATRVDAEGNIVPTRDSCGRPVVKDGCMTAFFIADGKTAMEHHKDGFIHHYNINLEIRGTDEHGGVAWQPLVIDPDIRNPGVSFK